MFSPRGTSESTWPTITFAQPETCSPPATGVTNKGYEVRRNYPEDWTVEAIEGLFQPADPYIYCQNDPNYKEHAATAAFINISGLHGSTGSDAWLQMGWKKERIDGQTSITR